MAVKWPLLFESETRINKGAVLLKAWRSYISESPPRTARKLRGAIEERSAAAIMGFFLHLVFHHNRRLFCALLE